MGSESPYYLAANRNKRSITLNYDHPRGAEALQKLLASADVFIIDQPPLVSIQKRASIRMRIVRIVRSSSIAASPGTD
jgi:hypothetical protein